MGDLNQISLIDEHNIERKNKARIILRVAVLKEDNCQQKVHGRMYDLLPTSRNGQECVVMDESTGKPHISESVHRLWNLCQQMSHDA